MVGGKRIPVALLRYRCIIPLYNRSKLHALQPENIKKKYNDLFISYLIHNSN